MRTASPLLLLLAVLGSGCAHRAPAPETATPASAPTDAVAADAPDTTAAAADAAEVVRIAGHYEAGWERAVLRPCGRGEYWWVWSEHRIIRDDSRGWGRAFVVVKGRVSAPGAYGHLGGYSRQVVVTELVEVRAADTPCSAAHQG